MSLVTARRPIAVEDPQCASLVDPGEVASRRHHRLTDGARLELPTYAERDLEEMGSFAPLVEVAGMRHARAERRLFTS